MARISPSSLTLRFHNPYTMGDEQVSFINFPEVLSETQDEDGNIRIAFVFGTGRHEGGEHPAYATDALLIPEVIMLLIRWAIGENLNLLMRSFLDIDLWESQTMSQYNLFLLGSGRVNILTAGVLRGFREELKVRFKYPTVGDICSDCSSRLWGHDDKQGRDAGLLTLMSNPWATKMMKRKMIVLAAGCNPIGTIAALKLLVEFLQNREKRQNNSKAQTIIPAKIVEGEHIKYCRKEIARKPGNRVAVYVGNLKEAHILE